MEGRTWEAGVNSSKSPSKKFIKRLGGGTGTEQDAWWCRRQLLTEQAEYISIILILHSQCPRKVSGEQEMVHGNLFSLM